MRGLEHRQKVHDLVTKELSYSTAVKDTMTWWLKCAEILFEMSLIMKSQEKISDDKLLKLKELYSDYVNVWASHLKDNPNTNPSEKNPIFWKLHMKFHMISFAEATGMIGILSAEQFENKHYVMSQIKKLFHGMAQDEMRCQKMGIGSNDV